MNWLLLEVRSSHHLQVHFHVAMCWVHSHTRTTVSVGGVVRWGCLFCLPACDIVQEECSEGKGDAGIT